MTEKEFLELYNQRLEKLVSDYKKEIKKSSHIKYIHLRNKAGEFSSQIAYKANLLISELLIENDINPNQLVVQDLTLVSLASNLLGKSFSIQLNHHKDFDKFTENILEKVYYRDHPKKDN